MTDRSDDGLPRLPRDGPPPQAERADAVLRPGSPADHGPVHDTEVVVRRVDWTEYEEPELLTLRSAGWAVLGTRIALAVWATSLVVVAVLLRASADDDTVSTATVSRVGQIGVLVAAVAVGAGWYWSDRATRDVHRLGGRLPGRARCVSAWLSPLAWFLVLSVTILRAEPTEPVDVRPAAAAVVFTLAVWRPYSLVRRILRSLIRVDSDLAIGAGYLLELASLGLLWARLASLPAELGPGDGAVAGVLLGLGAVAAIAAIGNVGIWYVVVRDVDRAVEHRRVAMRTRHQHRQLRLMGIDPLDPKVHRALVMIEQHARRSELVGPEPGFHPEGSHRAPVRDVRPALDDALPVRSADVTQLRLFDDETAATLETGPPAEDVRDDVPTSGVEQTEDGASADAAPPSGAVPTVDAGTARTPSDAATSPDDSQVEDAPVEPGPEEAGPVPSVRPSAPNVPDRGAPAEGEPTGRPEASRDPLDRLTARLRAERERPDSESSSSGGRPTRDRPAAEQEAGGRASPAERLRDRLASQPEGAGAGEDRIARLQGRLVRESAGADDRSILDRLERLGITPGSSPIPDDGTAAISDDSLEHERPLVIERLHSLELVRYLLVLATAVSAGASVWFVVRCVQVGELVAGEIDAAGLDRLETARVTTVWALSVALTLVPLWCAVAARWANRVGIDVAGTVRCGVLTGVAAVLLTVGLVAGPDSDLVGFVATGCLGAALWSVPVMIEVERGFGRGTTIPSLLPLALGFGVLTAWIGGLFGPLAPTDSLESLSFSGGLLALVLAIAAVVAAVSSGDVVEAIKLSPARPRPARTDTDRRDETEEPGS